MIKSKYRVKNSKGDLYHKAIVAVVCMAISPLALSMASYFGNENNEAHSKHEITAKVAELSKMLPSTSPVKQSNQILQLVNAESHIVFVDTSVPDYQRIVNAIDPSAELFLLNNKSSGVQQMAEVLKYRRNVQAVHVVAHGDEAFIQLGSSSLTFGKLNLYQPEMSVIRASLALEGDLLLYSCNTGHGERGQQFVEKLAMMTGADVAASNDLTGSANLNGDWDLEVRSGEIESDQPWSKTAIKDFNHVLVTETVSSYTIQGATLTSASTLGTSNFVISGSSAVTNFFGGVPTGAFISVASQDTPGLWLSTDVDGVNLQGFELTSLDLIEFEDQDVFQNFILTGYVEGGGTVTGSIASGTTGADSYTVNLTNFSGVTITGFKVEFDAIDNGGGNTFDANLEMISFTWNITPVIFINDSNLTYTENAVATQIDGAGTLTDSNADWNGGTLDIQITANSEGGDELSIPDNVVGAINTTGTSIRNGTTTIGTLSASEGLITNGTKLTITFNASATNALVQQVLQAISYRSSSDNPGGSDRTIVFTATDSSAATVFDSRTVSVSAVNDDPTMLFLPTDITVTEDTLSNVDLSTAILSDVDSLGGSIALTIAAGTGILASTSGGGVTIGNSGTSSITLTGTVSNIDSFLNTASSIQYTTAPNAQGNNASTLTLMVNDGGNTGLGGGGNVTLGSVNIDSTALGDTPSVTGASTNEDTQSTSGLVISRNVNDGIEVTHFKITSIAGGTLYKNDGMTVIANNSFITFAEGSAGLKFTPSANSITTGSFSVQAGTDGLGGGLSSGSVVATISITPVNDAPTMTNLSGDSVNFVIGGSGVALDAGGNTTLADIDSINFGGGHVTVSVVANAQTAEDALKIGTVGSITTSGSNVTHTDGFTIGSFSGGISGANLVITLNSNASVARVRDLLSALQYLNSNTGSANIFARTVRITVNDGGGGSATSANQDVTVNLLSAPALDLDGDNSSGNTMDGYNGTFSEDGGAVVVTDFDTTITDDGGTHTLLKATLTARPDGDGVESLSSTIINGATVGGDTVAVTAYNSGTGELIFTAAVGDVDGFLNSTTVTALMSSVQYNNTSQSPNIANRNIDFIVVDSSALTGAISTSVMTINRSNDSMTGTLAITGTPTEHLMLSADTSSLTDVDGLGAFSYQWSRNGSSIGSATGANYTLVRADVGETITVVAKQTDDGGTLESSTSAPTAIVEGDYDNDAIIDSIDTDDDGDGMPDDWETANGLDPFNDTDAAGDIDGDGLTNLFEYNNGKDSTVDDNPPAITVPATVNINATGLFTPVSLGSASALDIVDGVLTPTSDAKARYQPGVHTVTWSATDAAGNTGTATQTVNITPLIELSQDKVTAEGAAATFNVILNGSAVIYPVTVSYTLSGSSSTDGSDYDLVNGTATITSPNLSTTITANIVNDGGGEGAETMVVTLDSPTNAVLGFKSEHIMTIEEGNVAPDVTLSVDQGSGSTRLIQQAGANVVVTALATDANPADTLTYNWSATDNALTDLDGNPHDGSFTFDPITVGDFMLNVTITDSGVGFLTTSDALMVSVRTTLPTLDTSDSDGDMVDDITEGLGDSDNDGIPNYLDNVNLPNNTLQQKLLTSDAFVMETEPSLNMQLGQASFRAGGSRASVSDGDIVSHANNGAGAQIDKEYRFNGGVFDFSIDGLSIGGQSVNIVIPQQSAIPYNAVYRKLKPSGWMTFVDDVKNSVASAAGAEGYCPSPGDVAYQAGLIEGHWCVQLTIEDGGPNDADGAVDKKIEDPGGVGVLLVVSAVPADAVVEVNVSSGGGSLSPLWLSLLGLLAVLRILATRKKGVKNETL